MNRVNLITALLVVVFFVMLRISFAWGQTKPATQPAGALSEPTRGTDDAGRTYWVQWAVGPDGKVERLRVWADGQEPDAAAGIDAGAWAKLDDQLRQAELQAGSMKLLLDVAAARAKGTSAEAAVNAALDNAAATVKRLTVLREAAQATTQPSRNPG